VWQCPAITNGVVLYDDGKIQPCCVVSSDYSKSASEINNPNRFLDLYESKDKHCKKCIDLENAGIKSLRSHYISLKRGKPHHTQDIQFLDVRNSNFCNARCRICGPYNSSKWHQEIFGNLEIRHAPFDFNVLNDNLIEIYFAGGEPMIMEDHYRILHRCIEIGISNSIRLRYNSNLSTLTYKDQDIMELWKKFLHVHVVASADGVGENFEMMRTDLKWSNFEKNLKMLQKNNISTSILFVLNNLNIWFLYESLLWFKQNDYRYNIDLLTRPEELTLDEISQELIQKAIHELDKCADLIPSSQFNYFKNSLRHANDQ
jgi:hypothetical protein